MAPASNNKCYDEDTKGCGGVFSSRVGPVQGGVVSTNRAPVNKQHKHEETERRMQPRKRLTENCSRPAAQVKDKENSLPRPAQPRATWDVAGIQRIKTVDSQ